MHHPHRLASAAFALALASLAPSGQAQHKAAAASPALDTAAIEQTTGLKGAFSKEENVFKVSKPRSDLPVTVDGWRMPPFMGLTSWAAFAPAPRGAAMVMGDMVLFEDEVNAAMSAALDNGLEVTALHNHFFFDQPKVYFMHIGGMGPADRLAGAVRKVLETPQQVRSSHEGVLKSFGGATIGGENKISGEPIGKIFGLQGEARDGMYKITIGRTTKMHGVTAGKEMGVNTWAAFAGTDAEAVVDGDFAVREDELQPVLRSLRSSGINIVAIHQHMTHEQPRLVFLHYWGKGRAEDLARSVKKAVDLASSK